MTTNVITVSEFNAKSGENWSLNNVCEFMGEISGYVCGFNVEATKEGKISAGSCCFTNDYEEILDPNYNESWNDLGISAELMSYNGWEATGNIIFRGYFEEHYDFEEREYYYTDASEEVMSLRDKYSVKEII